MFVNLSCMFAHIWIGKLYFLFKNIIILFRDSKNKNSHPQKSNPIKIFSIRWNSHSLKEISNEIEEDLEELLSVIRRYFIRLRSIPDSMFHYAASHLGNKVCIFICKISKFYILMNLGSNFRFIFKISFT